MVNKNSPKKSPLKKNVGKDKSESGNSAVEMLNKNSPKKSPSKKDMKKKKPMNAQKKKILDKETIIINHNIQLEKHSKYISPELYLVIHYDVICTQILDTKQKMFSAPPEVNKLVEPVADAEQMGNTLEEKTEVISSDYSANVAITVGRI